MKMARPGDGGLRSQVLRKLMQEDCKFEASLCHITRPWLKIKSKKRARAQLPSTCLARARPEVQSPGFEKEKHLKDELAPKGQRED